MSISKGRKTNDQNPNPQTEEVDPKISLRETVLVDAEGDGSAFKGETMSAYRDAEPIKPIFKRIFSFSWPLTVGIGIGCLSIVLLKIISCQMELNKIEADLEKRKPIPSTDCAEKLVGTPSGGYSKECDKGQTLETTIRSDIYICRCPSSSASVSTK